MDLSVSSLGDAALEVVRRFDVSPCLYNAAGVLAGIIEGIIEAIRYDLCRAFRRLRSGFLEGTGRWGGAQGKIPQM
jgi:hypothetical protein